MREMLSSRSSRRQGAAASARVSSAKPSVHHSASAPRISSLAVSSSNETGALGLRVGFGLGFGFVFGSRLG